MPLTAKEADRLVDVIKGFVKGGQAAQASADERLAALADETRTAGPSAIERAATPPGIPVVFDDAALEDLYRKFKARLLEELQVDAIFLKILASRPEVSVLVEPHVVELTDASLKGRICLLMADGFIKKGAMTPRGDILAELERTGSRPGGRFDETLSGLVEEGILERGGRGEYQVAPGVKVSSKVVSSR